jgi:N6-adenosine-specific RNA methylase IME4
MQTLFDTKYKTILIDPPWPIKFIPREKTRPGQILNYNTMSLEDITNLPINEMADEQCHLYLWTTHKYLEKSFDIIRAWGFDYHCTLTWDKGIGITPFSFMFSTEFCLFCQRPGKWLDLKQKGIKTLIKEQATDHSRKPKAMYGLIESVSYSPYLEMFARRRREGWAGYGDQLETQIQTTLKEKAIV